MSKLSPRSKQHNHVNKIKVLIRKGVLRAEPGSIQSIEVAHDDDCGIFNGGLCNCDPDVRLRWSQSARARN